MAKDLLFFNNEDEIERLFTEENDSVIPDLLNNEYEKNKFDLPDMSHVRKIHRLVSELYNKVKLNKLNSSDLSKEILKVQILSVYTISRKGKNYKRSAKIFNRLFNKFIWGKKDKDEELMRNIYLMKLLLEAYITLVKLNKDN